MAEHLPSAGGPVDEGLRAARLGGDVSASGGVWLTMGGAMPTWQSFDRHRYYTEDRFVYWEPHGPVQEPHARGLLILLDAAGCKSTEVCVLMDQRATVAITPEVRKIYVSYLRDLPKLRLAIVNTSTILRASVTLTLSAFRILSPNRLHYQLFKGPEEAMAWLHLFRVPGGASETG